VIVYGDHAERVDTRERLAELAEGRERVLAMPPGLARHAALVGLFVDAAGLAQGVADALFAADGVDRPSEAQDACLAILLPLAAAVRTSWDTGFESIGVLPESAAAAPLPDTVDVRLPEGYAFYALYPEAYIEAARDLRLAEPLRVIGIRSIGVGLATLVAVALGAPPPVTLRPVGHPFDRRVDVAPTLAAELLSPPSATYVIVDEGPGLSGSSFGAVADFLERNGVPPDRIAFLSGHGGDLGPQAGERHRARWATARRRSADAEAFLTDHLAGWAAESLGGLDAPLEDIAGGGWRRRLYADEADWPAVNPMWERHKRLARSCGETWLLKFAGLGRIGERRLARARALHACGYAPEPRGLVHGFLVEQWMDGASPLDRAAVPGDERMRMVAGYLGLRSRLFAASNAAGASLAELLAMARFNTLRSLGADRAAALDRWRPRLADLGARVKRIETDNRCLAHEWLRAADGRLLKADGLDHHASHDLIGCQDIAWDVVGASFDLDLPPEALAAAVERAGGRRPDDELMAFLAPCYLAFRIGWHRLAAESLGGWPDERRRNEAAAEAHAARLGRLLDERAG